MLLMGSTAAALLGVDLGRPLGLDIDVIIDPKELPAVLKRLKDDTLWCRPLDRNHMALGLGEGYILEMEIAWPGTTGEMLLQEASRRRTSPPGLSWNMADITGLGTVQLPSPSALLALKMSHRYKKDSPHFLKTMRDIHALRKWHEEKQVAMAWGDWIAARETETYGNKLPNLMRSKKDFFRGDSVPYTYDHDTLHLAVKHMDRPAYQYFSTDGQEVYSSRERFFSCSPNVRLLAVLEETYVLALERSQVPFDFKPDPKLSFDIALEKVCTSITGGWFREFAWEHYDEVQEMYNASYVDTFKRALANGIVKRYEDGSDAHA